MRRRQAACDRPAPRLDEAGRNGRDRGYCGPRLPPAAIEIPNPVIVVKVLSEGKAARDRGVKLVGYFSLPTVAHYLILDPERRTAVHHRRGQGDLIETRILTAGPLRLDQPGLELTVAELFGPA